MPPAVGAILPSELDVISVDVVIIIIIIINIIRIYIHTICNAIEHTELSISSQNSSSATLLHFLA